MVWTPPHVCATDRHGNKLWQAKPYVKGNKNDHLDAAAIVEAMARPEMRFVAVKSTAQQDLQALHRVRSERVCRRTAKVNQIRGLIAWCGATDCQCTVDCTG